MTLFVWFTSTSSSTECPSSCPMVHFNSVSDAAPSMITTGFPLQPAAGDSSGGRRQVVDRYHVPNDDDFPSRDGERPLDGVQFASSPVHDVEGELPVAVE